MKVCIAVIVQKIDIFSFYLLYRSLQKSKNIKKYYLVKLTRSRYFHVFKKRHRVHARYCFTFCAITLEHFVVTTQPRPF